MAVTANQSSHLHSSPAHKHDLPLAHIGHTHSSMTISSFTDPFVQYSKQPPAWDLPLRSSISPNGEVTKDDLTTTVFAPSDRSFKNSFTMPRPSLRSRGVSDLGRAADDSPNQSNSTSDHRHDAHDTIGNELTSSQILTGVLFPIPWFLVAHAFRRHLPVNITDSGISFGEPRVANGSIIDACFVAFVVASISFLGITAGHRAQQSRRSWKGKGPARRSQRLNGSLSTKSAAEVATRIFGLVLPLIGAMLLGGFPVALVLTVAQTFPFSGSSPSARIVSALKDGKNHLLKFAAILLTLMLAILSKTTSMASSAFGLLCLLISLIACPLPILTATSSAKSNLDSQSSAIATLKAAGRDRIYIPMASYVSAFLAVICYFLSPSPHPSSIAASSFVPITAFSIIAAITLVDTAHYSVRRNFTYLSSIVTLSIFSLSFAPTNQMRLVSLAFLALSYTASYFDSRLAGSATGHKHRAHSVLTHRLLSLTSPGSILHSVLSEASSRRIAYFGVINLVFMLIQFFYGFATGSLGLLTDSIHMLFDCLGLGVGLAAAVMTKWSPSQRFPYGFAKVSTLSGFANGMFLILVSVEIVLDALHRLREGCELRRLNELLVVSILGLLVNIIGLTAFADAHHHGHDHGSGDGHHHHHDDNMRGIYLHVLSDALGSVAVIISTLLTKYNTWHGWDPLASCIIAIAIAASAYPLVKSSGSRLLLSLSDEAEYKSRGALQGLSELPDVKGYAGVRLWLQDQVSDSHNHQHHDHEHSHHHSHGHHDQEHSLDHNHDHPNHHHSDHHDPHDQSHENGHAHNHKSCSSDAEKSSQSIIVGVLHIMTTAHADIDRVRQRTESYLRSHDMDVVVHVEKDGTNCWCGGGSRISPR